MHDQTTGTPGEEGADEHSWRIPDRASDHLCNLKFASSWNKHMNCHLPDSTAKPATAPAARFPRVALQAGAEGGTAGCLGSDAEDIMNRGTTAGGAMKRGCKSARRGYLFRGLQKQMSMTVQVCVHA
jgi:hypothetical protein